MQKDVSVVGETSDRGETGENGSINLEIRDLVDHYPMQQNFKNTVI